MIIDKELEFSNEQAVTASAGSTNVVDLGSARDIGMGGKYIAVSVSEAAAAAGAATVVISLEKAASEDFSDKVVVVSTQAIPKADLVAGYRAFLPIPVGADARYLRVYYTVATGPLTAGKFSAQVVESIQKNDIYTDFQ